MVHIPRNVRERICAIASDCVEGSLAGELKWGLLGKSMHKLLLANCPQGVRAEVELATRISLWEGDDLGTLIARIEWQANKSFQNAP